ncbi:hypothetical protein FJR38_06665 [Anabaena sp. UHCC 0253]|uniref:hypothetical protein n=1 Tax=Anabaena sp. UHCC 0253 TaxID=2590019 RepID=UPI001444FCB4|nr:hypothetical protein [Anabaena sp. UHCC 0253]MTJ52373.1 hypothetical protein [Anabaena sp. UHCC 0253]
MQNDSSNKVDYSEWECLILYNYIPRLIEKYAILVNISAHYYTSGNQEISLTENPKGDYWIIASDNNIYWLFPNTKLKSRINTPKKEVLSKLFEFYNYENSDSREVILKKPAQVFPSSSGEGWILAKQGIIDFNNSSFLEIINANNKSSENIPKLKVNQNNEQQNLITQVSREEFNEYILESQKEIIQLKSQVQQLIEIQQRLQGEIERINENYGSLETKLENNFPNHQIATLPEKTTSQQEKLINTSSSVNLNAQELRIVEAYNSNPVIISQQAKQVAETNTSIEKRIQGNIEAIVLEKQAQGYYWLIGREQLYVMPRKHLNINRATVESIRILFECKGSKATSKFKLLKPAKVVMIGNSQTWQLTERGIIEFE